MPNPRNIQINKFTRGIVRDGVDDAGFLQSLRNIMNYDIDYTRGQLVIRNGYQRYHTTALASDAQQVYHFVDTSQNENTLVICNGKLYLLSDAASNPEIKNSSVSPSASVSFTAGEKYPFETVDDRCFFADDNDFYWCDNTSLASNECYQVGIDKPDIDDFSFSEGNFTEQLITTTAHQYLDPPQKREYAQSITNNTEYYACDGIKLYLSKDGSPKGSMRVTVETDSSGNPSGTLVNDDSYSNWVSVDESITGTTASPVWIDFQLQLPFVMNKATTYHFVVEFNTGYVETADGSNHVNVHVDTGLYSGGGLKYWDGSTWTSIANQDASFVLGLQYDQTRYYKFAYYNNDNVIESVASEMMDAYLAQAGGLWEATKITIPANSTIADGQVTHVRIYRTKAAGTDYYFLAQIALSSSTEIIWDTVDDSSLSDTMTSGIQRPKDKDGNALVPKYIANWRRRLWLAKENDNHIYYSMRLDADGALGYTGDSLYDAYYDSNYEPIRVKDTIQGLMTIGVVSDVAESDYLVIYMKNRIYVVDGAASVLNPMDDVSILLQYSDTGLLAPNSLVGIGSKHYFLSRGANNKPFVAEFDGKNVRNVSYDRARGLYIQSMLDEWENIEDTFAVANGQEYWIIADQEGFIRYDEEIYDEEYYGVPSTQIIYLYDITHNNWRTYQYYHTMNHIHIPQSSTLSGTILLCPQKDIHDNTKHVMRVVNTVYTDRDDDNNEINIAGLIETQDLRPLTSELPYNPRRWLRPPTAWHHVVVDDYQAGNPSYTFKVRDKDGNVKYADLAITANPRTKRTGLRINSDECRFRVRQFSNSKDEIRGIIAEWTEM